MVDIQQVFSDTDRARIAAAVQQAEAETSAEIVPAVAAASGRYDRAEDTFGFWLAVLVAGLVWWFWPRYAESGTWAATAPGWTLAAMVLGMVVMFILGVVIASRVGWLRRLLTPEGHMEEEVVARAGQVFFDRRIHHTRAGSGVLIYLSLEERMAYVCADEAVHEALGPTGLAELRTLLVTTTAKEGPTAALCAVVQEAGRRLAPQLPRGNDDQNELSDALVLLSAP